jgi:GT2 family glycosyltransferase
MDKLKNNFNVSVVIPNYNGAHLLRKNLPSVIAAMAEPANAIAEIVVVDDKSLDNSVEVIRKEFPAIRLFCHTKRRGVSAGMNTGVRAARGNLIALINTDVSVSKDFLVHVLPHFDNPKIFAVSLKEKDYSWASAKFDDGFISFGRGKSQNVARNTFWVSGGSGVFRRNLWVKLGGMDEKMYSPYYHEDVDLSYRAQKRGFMVIWEPRAVVIHEHESTVRNENPKKKSLIQQRNQLLFIWKNVTSTRMFRKHLKGLSAYVLRHPGYVRVLLIALRKFPLVLKARKREKKEAKISDEAIFALNEK